MLRYEYAQYKRDHATMTQLQDQSTRLIIAALYDLKNQYESNPADFPPEGSARCRRSSRFRHKSTLLLETSF